MGNSYKSEWVTSYQVFTSLDGTNFTTYSHIINGKTPNTFSGNTDNTTEVTQLFNRNIIGRYMRIYPKTWHVAPSLMFEILGCNPSEPVGSTTAAPVLISGQTPTDHPDIGSNSTPSAVPPIVTGQPPQHKTTARFGEIIFPPMPNFSAPPRGKHFI